MNISKIGVNDYSAYLNCKSNLTFKGGQTEAVIKGRKAANSAVQKVPDTICKNIAERMMPLVICVDPCPAPKSLIFAFVFGVADYIKEKFLK